MTDFVIFVTFSNLLSNFEIDLKIQIKILSDCFENIRNTVIGLQI